MKVKIINFGEKKEIATIKIKKNISDKNILKNIENFLTKEYHCSIRDCLITGSIDLATHKNNLHYILFGENLPFREMSFEIINEDQ